MKVPGSRFPLLKTDIGKVCGHGLLNYYYQVDGTFSLAQLRGLALTVRLMGVAASLHGGDETVWCFERFPVPFHVLSEGRRRQKIRC